MPWNSGSTSRLKPDEVWKEGREEAVGGAFAEALAANNMKAQTSMVRFIAAFPCHRYTVTPHLELLHGLSSARAPARCSTLRRVMPEGRHIARITCRACGRRGRGYPAMLRGLSGPPLFRALRVRLAEPRGGCFDTLGVHRPHGALKVNTGLTRLRLMNRRPYRHVNSHLTVADLQLYGWALFGQL